MILLFPSDFLLIVVVILLAIILAVLIATRQKKSILPAGAGELGLMIEPRMVHLYGPSLEYLNSEMATYNCMYCHKLATILLKHYKHEETSSLILLGQHVCIGLGEDATALVETLEIASVTI